MKKYFLMAVVFLLSLASCEDHDELWQKYEDLDNRLTNVEARISEMDSNITLLQQLINKRLFITDVTNNNDGSYTLSLITPAGEYQTITIGNGKDG